MDSRWLLFLVFILSPSHSWQLTFNSGDTYGLKYLKGDLSIAAVADFNDDKRTDLLLLNRTQGNDNLIEYVWSDRKKQFKEHRQIFTDVSIGSVGSGDFNGDGALDLLITTTDYRGYIKWSNNDTLVPIVDDIEKWRALPIIMDYNGDHIVDIMTVVGNKLVIYLSQQHNTSFITVKQPLPDGAIKPSANVSLYYTDLNSDCLSDIIVFSEIEQQLSLTVWTRDPKSMKFSFNKFLHFNYSMSSDVIMGNPAFSDINGDGVLDMILYSCYSTCQHPQVNVYYQHSGDVNVLDCDTSSSWSLNWAKVSVFNLSYATNEAVFLTHTPTIGDINLDGYPDLLVTGHDANSSSVALLLNDGRQFTSYYVASSHRYKGVMFYDLLEDGILDIVAMAESGSSPFLLYRQEFNEDSLFLKALILSGYCSDCGTIHYGSILPGAVIAVTTYDRNGHQVTGMSVTHQGCTHPNNPALPYVILGLGHTPNFINKLTIGMAHQRRHDNNKWYRAWYLLVPNAQVVLLPRPPNDPARWRLELYLAPNNNIYIISGALFGVCIVLFIVTLLLHGREKYQDRKERKLAKQKFHFNKM